MLRLTVALRTYRQLAERFWEPFSRGVKGADVAQYRARENLLTLIGRGSRGRRLVSGAGLAAAAAAAEANYRNPQQQASAAASGGVGGSSSSSSLSGDPAGGGVSVAAPRADHVLPSPEPLRLMMESAGGAVFGADDRMVMSLDDFTCQVNGIVGSVDTIENMFITILTGFDIVKVVMDPAPERGAGGTVRGTIFVHHCRPFLGWQPTHSTIFFPFSMFMEGDRDGERTLSHLVLRFEFDEALRGAGCPDEVLRVLCDREALVMLASLRRVRVRPEAITCETLARAAEDKSRWDKAVGPYV